MQNFPKINIFLIVKLHVQEKEPFFFYISQIITSWQQFIEMFCTSIYT